MNEELRQQALKFNDTQKQSFNALVNSGNFTPDEAVYLIIGGKDTKQTFGEQAKPAVQTIGTGLKEISTLKPRKILGGVADVVKGGLGVVGASLETVDDAITSGATGEALTKIIKPVVDTKVVQDIMKGFNTFDKKTGGVAGDILTIGSVLPVGRIIGKVADVAKAGIDLSKLKTAPLFDYLARGKESAGVVSGLAKNVGQRIETNVERLKGVVAEQKHLSELPTLEAKAIRGGVPEQDISTFKEILKNPEENKVLKEMFENAKKPVADKTIKADLQREILGREFLKPIEFLTNKKVEIGSELGKIRQGLDGVKKINTNNAFQEFYKMLTDKYGAKINKNKFIVDQTGASGSLEKSTVNALTPQLQKLYSETFMTQKDIDNWLKSTLEEFDVVNAVDKVKAPDIATKIIKDTRGIYKQLMPNNYNKALEDYAKVVTPLEKVKKTLKITQNVDDLSVKDLKAGEIARRLGGNASADLKELIAGLLDIANEYGYTGKVNLSRLATISDDIDKMYDINRVTSLRGDVSAAISLPPTTLTGAVLKGVEKLLGGNYSKEETRKLLEAWIDSQ